MEEQDYKPSTESMQSLVGEIKGCALVGLSARNNALKGQPDHSPGQAKRHPGNKKSGQPPPCKGKSVFPSLAIVNLCCTINHTNLYFDTKL